MENTQTTDPEDFNPFDIALPTDELETSEVESTEEESEQSVEEISTESVEADGLAQATYEALVEKGLFDADDKFDGSFDYIDEKLEGLPDKLLNQAISNLPEHSQSVLKYISTAGDNLTPDELKDFMREYLNEQNLPDVSTQDSARSYLEEQLKAQGLRPAAIQAQLDDLEDSNELISEAQKSLDAKEKKTQALIESKAQENQKITEDQKQFYQSVQTALVETKWSKSQQEKVLQTAPNANNIVNKIVSQPKAYIQFIDFLSKFDGKEFDMEAYKKQGEARATSSLREKIEKSGFSSASSTTATSTQDIKRKEEGFDPTKYKLQI